MGNTRSFASEVVRSAIAAVSDDQVDDLDRLDPDADVWSALELDSLDHLAVMTQIAEVTGVDIAERDYPRLLSMAQLCAHVDRVLR